MNNKFYFQFYYEGEHKTWTIEESSADQASKRVWPKAKLWARTVKLRRPWQKFIQPGPKLTRVFTQDGTVILESKGIGARHIT